VLERWTRDAVDGPAFLERVTPERYHLGRAHAAERAHLEESATMVLRASARGRASAQKRANVRNKARK
jgi:hypothetical protein